MKNVFFFSLFSLTACAPFAHADEHPIQLSPDALPRLGIVFSSLKSGAEGSGPRFPATVISSPEGASTLTAPYAGVIESWLTTPGAPVRAGQDLVVIRSQDVLSVQQAWMSALTEREAARAELERSERLQKEGIVSSQRVLQSRRAYDQAAFAQQAAEEALRRVGFTSERLDAMRAKGEGLGRYRLMATSEGVVTRRVGTLGDFIEANSTLFRLRSVGPNWIELQVPARVGSGVSLGQKLRLSAGEAELVLRHKDHGVDDRSQTIGLFAEFEDETPHLPGQIVSVEIPPPADGILVPSTAVVHSGDETSVFVRTERGIEMRKITTQPVGVDYLALSGIQPGEHVAVRGAAVLKGIKAGFGRTE